MTITATGEPTVEEMREATELAAEGVQHLLNTVDHDQVDALVRKLSRHTHKAPADVALCALVTLATSECFSTSDPPAVAMVVSAFMALLIQQGLGGADDVVH